MRVNRRWTGRLAGAMIALVLLAGWRPSPAAAPFPVLRSTAKGPRRSPSELPQSGPSRLKDAERRSEPGRPAPAPSSVEDSPTGSFTVVSRATRGRIADERTRPRYLQACLQRDSRNSIAPPAA